MKNIKLSVIIPTYNRCKLLDYTLKSLERQTMKKEYFEVIICDDGSNDNTFELVRAYSNKINIKYYYHIHEEFRAALTRNMGIHIAKGNICLFLDSGMIASKDFLQAHSDAHLQAGSNCIVLGHILGFDVSVESETRLKKLFDINSIDVSFDNINSKEFMDERENTLNYIGKDMNKWPAPWIYFWSGNVSIEKSELEKVGLFNEEYVGWGGEDTDLGIRLFLNGLKYTFSKEASAIHYPHEHSVIDENELKKRVLERKSSLCKKYGLQGMEHWLTVGSKNLNNFLFDSLGVSK